MPLDRLIDKEPRQFAYFHRLMGYSILSLILVIYTFTSTSASYQLYLLPLLLAYFLFCPRLEKWLQYKFDKKIEKMFYLPMKPSLLRWFLLHYI